MAELDGVVLHVGMNKSGSTWLQRQLFPRLADRHFVGRGRETDVELSRALRSMARPGFTPGSVRRLLLDRAARARRPLLVSDEVVLATLLHQDESLLDGSLVHLHREVPEARVLLVIRRPADLVRSSHAQYVKRGGTASLARFCSGEPLPGYRFCARSYDVGWIHRRLAHLYGPDRVHVAIYEELVTSPDVFLDRVGGVVGTGAAEVARARSTVHKLRNPSLTPTGTRILRRLNRVAVRSEYNPDPPAGLFEPPGPHRRLLRAEMRLGLHRPGGRRRSPRRDARLLAEIGASYVPSNRELAARTGLPLEQLGYF